MNACSFWRAIITFIVLPLVMWGSVSASTRSWRGAVKTLDNKYFYMFTDSKYFKYGMTGQGQVIVQPSTTTLWSGLKGPIDAALTWIDKKTYFFSGTTYTLFDLANDRTESTNSPINARWDDVLKRLNADHLDAVINMEITQKTYFFADGLYAQYDNPTKKIEHVKSIEEKWPGLPKEIDAAVYYDAERVYFFKGGQYWRWRAESATSDQGYPRVVADMFPSWPTMSVLGHRKPSCADVTPVTNKLRLRSDGTFKIAQFTDLHFDETAQIIKDNTRIIETTLDSAKPDLAVFTGDIISGYLVNSNKVNAYGALQEKVVAPLIARNVPWAIILGNHDDEGTAVDSRMDIMCMDAIRSPLSHTFKSPVRSGMDYILPVYNHGDDGVAIWLLMMDSGTYGCQGAGKYGCVEVSQIQWLTRVFTPEFHKKAPALSFTHISPPEMALLHLQPNNLEGVDKDQQDPPTSNTGYYNALKELGNVKSLHFGHDHNNEFRGRLNGDGPLLVYGRKSGYGYYGPDFMKRGARLIQYQKGDAAQISPFTYSVEDEKSL